MVDYYWNSKTGRFHDKSNNVFVKRADVLKHLDIEHNKSKVRMQGLARRLVSNKLTLPEFQTLMIDELKGSHLRMALLSSGGKNGISNNGYLSTARTLKEQYRYLNGFVNAIASGEMTENGIINRAGMYANSSAIAFNNAEKVNRIENGAVYGRRVLDPQAQHCASCIKYERKEWTPVEEIVPRGTNCECHQNCKCTVFYSYNAANFSSTILRTS